MVARGFREAWSTSSVLVKLGIIGAGLIVLIILVISTKSYITNRSYEKREAARATEREARDQQIQQLQQERDALKLQVAELEGRTEATRQVAETKRADRTQTLKELDAIEQDYQRRKTEMEASGGSMPDDELRRRLCERLSKRPGYKACD